MNKTKKSPLIVAGEINHLSEKQLQDMGKYLTHDGLLISSTKKYTVEVTRAGWIICPMKQKVKT